MPTFPNSTSAPGRWRLKDARDAQMGSNWPTVRDPFFQNVSLLISGDGLNNSQNNTFLDSSSNNFTVTRSGNVTQGTFTPFGEYWSVYLDGVGDYITVADNAALNMDASDFTIECWFYPTNATQSGPLFAKRANSTTFSGTHVGFSGNLTPQGLATVNGTSWGVNITSTVSCVVNSWNHIAWVRTGTTWRLFVNGQLGASATLSGTVTTNTSAFSIGGTANGSGGTLQGFISNLRVVKGTVVYTSTSLIIPTNTLTAITNTSLLTCISNRYIDSSTNNLAVTAINTTISRFNPFDLNALSYNSSTIGGSLYFDGTSDWLSLPASTQFDFGTGDFTIECWIWTTVAHTGNMFNTRSNATNGLTFRVNLQKFEVFYGSGSGIITASTNHPLNQWTHVVLERFNGVTTIYQNGTSIGTTTAWSGVNISQNPSGALVGRWNISAPNAEHFNGYISNLRIVKGRAVYQAAFKPSTVPLMPITNTSLLLSGTNAAIIDFSEQTNIETVGDTKISTVQSRWGSSSISFDGTGDYLIIPSSGYYGYGTGDFTIEFWLRMTSSAINQTLVSNLTSVSSTNPHLYFKSSDSRVYYWTANADRITGNILALNTWYHIAVSRASGSTRLFVDGQQAGSTYVDANDYGAAAPVGVGTYFSGGIPVTSNTLSGFIDDLRITRGIARYTANFTPPTALPRQ